MIKYVTYYDENGNFHRMKCNTKTASFVGHLTDIEAIRSFDLKTFQKFQSKKTECDVYQMNNRRYFVHVKSVDEQDIVLVPDEQELILMLSDYLTVESLESLAADE